jgi:hypothetical protein
VNSVDTMNATNINMTIQEDEGDDERKYD